MEDTHARRYSFAAGWRRNPRMRMMSCWRRQQETTANDSHPSTTNEASSSFTLGVHGVSWSLQLVDLCFLGWI